MVRTPQQFASDNYAGICPQALVKARALFGGRLPALLDELTDALVA